MFKVSNHRARDEPAGWEAVQAFHRLPSWAERELSGKAMLPLREYFWQIPGKETA